MSKIVALIFALGVFVPACEAKMSAQVNGENISSSAVEQRMWAIYGDNTLNTLIDEALVRQQVGKLGLTANDQEIQQAYQAEKGTGKAADDFVALLAARGISEKTEMDNVRFRVLARRLTVKMLGLQVTDAEVESFFKENRAKFDKPESVSLTQITTATRQEAQDMLTALAAGTEFKKLAVAKCSANKLCPADAAAVTIYRGQLGDAAEKTVFAVSPGSYSGIVENNGYFHVLKVLSFAPATPADLAQLKEQLRDALLQSKIDKGVSVMISKLRADAKITVKNR